MISEIYIILSYVGFQETMSLKRFEKFNSYFILMTTKLKDPQGRYRYR